MERKRRVEAKMKEEVVNYIENVYSGYNGSSASILYKTSDYK